MRHTMSWNRSTALLVEGLRAELWRRLKPLVRSARRGLLVISARVGRRKRTQVVPKPRRRLRAPDEPQPSRHPAIAIVASGSVTQESVTAFLDSQTETSVTLDTDTPTSYLAILEGSIEGLPSTVLESLLLAATAEDLDLCLAGRAPPSCHEETISTHLDAAYGASGVVQLVRSPTAARAARTVVGRLVPHITGSLEVAAEEYAPALETCGPYLLSFEAPGRRLHRVPVFDVARGLGNLPSIPGPRTVLFLLPHLAVGGAERLLFDLIGWFRGRYRCLIVTLEPHSERLGQTLDQARRLTPHVYTLGDWLPREAQGGVLRHLIRRYEVETLFSWNATSWFYDEARKLARERPGLRLLNQLYDHQVGWIRHYGPQFRHAVAGHVAVNQAIVEALKQRGVDEACIHLIHHGVELPTRASAEQRRTRRRERCAELGLDTAALIVGTFVRLHPQKRPLDVVALARRWEGSGIFFLLIGSGPLEGELRRALEGACNLLWLPATPEIEPYFDALDLCLLTSEYEGLPVFLLEGLARGLPCVATAVGDVPLLLERGGGVLVDRPGDLDALEEGLRVLMDESRRRREGALGRQTVEERFSLESYGRAYEKLLFPPPERGGE